jgi:carboxyl-terminal processing protease
MMGRKIKWGIVLLVIVSVTVAFRQPAEKYFEIAKSLDIFATLFKEVNAYYVDDVDPEDLVRKGIDGMLETLDPYTGYIPEDEIESFRIATTGQYGGIGALIGLINDKVVITQPYENFPAMKSGLKVGDEILSVDGTNVKGKATSEVSALLKGNPKTDVTLIIQRPGVVDPISFIIQREKINVSNLAYTGMVEPEVGYIKLDDFTPGAAREVSDAVVKLKVMGAKSIILDLRDNPGGLLHEAVNIVNVFIPKGKEVVATKGKVKDWNKSYTTLNNPVDTKIKLAVLTGPGSASASEIVAGALQDYDRAVLVGKKTFGKGLVQTTRPLTYNSQLKVTTAKYYIPSGRCIQALDYTHRQADGSVEKFPDSLKTEFKTTVGRSVFDGAGLDPDIEVETEYLSVVAINLITSGLIFDYASKYCGDNPTLPDFKTFALSDKDYDGFVEWIDSKKFTYITRLEKSADELIEVSKEEKNYKDLAPLLTDLKKKVSESKGHDLIRFKSEIVELLT